MRILLAAIIVTSAAACGPVRPPAPLVFPFPVETNRAETLSPGVTLRFITSPAGPWAVSVLDVDLTRCHAPVALKGAAGAAGRRKTSELLAELARSREVVGGVNADFFTLAGFQGVPTGALISEGRVIVGPGAAPLLTVDSAGTVRAGVLGFIGTIVHRGESRGVEGWNRPAPRGVAVFDAAWGARLDTATNVIEVTVEGDTPSRVVAVDTTREGAAIPRNGRVIIAGRNAPAGMRQWLGGLMAGDTLRISLELTPFHPSEAVGGRPMLARDSVVLDDVNTEGAASFRARHPRTAVGLSNGKRRMILAVIDGRRPGYSDGMTLRETADLMLALGSRDAINLDGGGSSALVYRDPAGVMRVANRPSDAGGERAVGDALAIVKTCR